MWSRFTTKAREAVWASLDEAKAVGAKAVGAEHLFLALLRDRESVATRILWELGADFEGLRTGTVARLTPTGQTSPEPLQITPRYKLVIEAAYETAWDLNTNYIGTEHLLLGLLKERGSLAALVMHDAAIEHAAAFQKAQERMGPPASLDGD